VTGDTPTIDDWAAQHVRPCAAATLRGRPELVEQVHRGRTLGLTWPQLAEWVGLHGITITARELANALRH
jgi:hypothetical protein